MCDKHYTRYKLAGIGVLSIISAASANSTASYLREGAGLDYYWVPGNMLLFHIPYPLDFILYFFAAVGALWCIHKIYCMIVSGWP
jgi:hypothetical protein